MRCPICKAQFEWAASGFRPFCSERCQLIDLDHWLSGRYRISTTIATPDDSAERPDSEAWHQGDS